MKYTYLLVDASSVIVPFAFSFHNKIKFNRCFVPFFKANAIASLLFLIWDVYFTSKGIWNFNSHYTLGINVFNLPVEEVLFFICIPFSCLFTYHCIQLFFQFKRHEKFENKFIILFAIILLVIGIIYFERAYTATTFISASIVLVILKFYFKVDWLLKFFYIYIILLIPFFVVNGILTGTGLEHPVVSYNNNENLGIRLLTIPIEDVIYGMELLLLNLFFFEHYRSNNRIPSTNAGNNNSRFMI